ncbi:MAG: OFA family MFS transporter [Betaproteobacteria bacterium]|nr:OFA family MFS transporter [Betaproteobacteria bacterium]
MESQAMQKKANLVLLACILFNVSIGVLYAWSVLKAKLTSSLGEGGWEWISQQAGLPYTIAIISFAAALLIGGRIQDKIGPRAVITAGGVLTGVGLILSGLVGDSVVGVTICYGAISGIGAGLGYGCATPPALKWFHPSKKGLVSGLIVGGFGLSAVCFSLLTDALLNRVGIQQTLVYMGVVVTAISVLIAQLIKNPPVGYIPAVPLNLIQSATQNTASIDFHWKEMLKTKRFYLLFVMFLLSSSVGLMIIGNIARIAQTQISMEDAAIIVALLAITNTLGRVIGGLMSDKIGRVNALFVVFALQTLNMAGFALYQSLPMLILGVILVGFCYGTLLSVFPSMTADQYGLKNFGTNYGVLFLSWGLAGVVAPIMADVIYDANGNFYTAYIVAAIMMASLIFVNFLLRSNLASLKRSG